MGNPSTNPWTQELCPPGAEKRNARPSHVDSNVIWHAGNKECQWRFSSHFKIVTQERKVDGTVVSSRRVDGEVFNKDGAADG